MKVDAGLDPLLQEAIDLKNQHDYPAAAAKLASIIRKFPKSAAALGLLGNLYLLKLNKLPQAIRCLRRTTQLSPRSEMASLSLFHALWDSGQQVEALEEMKRFLRLSHSDDYVEILARIREKRLTD